MTEWWQQLIFSLVTISFGAFLGYFLSRRGAGEERKLRDIERLSTTGRNILSELETNIGIAKTSFDGKLMPFVTSMFDAYKGEIVTMPHDLQDALYIVYVEILKTNAVVQADLHKVQYGRGYLDETYKDQCSKIEAVAPIAEELLKKWLKKEGVREMFTSAKR